MHWIQPDLSPLDDAVSYYMNGPFGWILSLGLVSVGLASLAELAAIHQVVTSKGRCSNARDPTGQRPVMNAR